MYNYNLACNYRILGIVRGRKICKFRESESNRECFLALFNLGRNFYIRDCLNRESFLANYGKEGNSRNFSSADDSRYTVSALHHLIIHNTVKPTPCRGGRPGHRLYIHGYVYIAITYDQG